MYMFNLATECLTNYDVDWQTMQFFNFLCYGKGIFPILSHLCNSFAFLLLLSEINCYAISFMKNHCNNNTNGKERQKQEKTYKTSF